MGAQGTAVLNFGAFPGSSVATVDVAAAGVISTSAVEAWIRPVVSADHSMTDHMAAPMRVVGRYLSNDNIRIIGMNTNDVIPPNQMESRTLPTTAGIIPKGQLQRQNSPMLVGQYNVNWVWN